MSISLVAGLGNPGRAYDRTRHNIGFRVVEALASELRLSWKREAAFEAEVARWDRAPGDTWYLAKPQTFMNDSGRSVQALARFYRIPPESIVAVYDDLTIDLGRIKVTVTGSAGGHNGVASLIEHLGSAFPRFRIGIGPKQPPEMDLKDFVLGVFTPEQQTIVDQQFPSLVAGLRLLLEQGPDRAMNSLNRKDSK
jgi:peptidyl-tRNA hydrolase, PTH1 family